MSYGKLAKGFSEDQAKRKLQQVMPLQKRETDFSGASPPSVFIGSHNYPKVSAGVLSPQQTHNSSLMDSPDQWFEKDYSIERVASLRTSLVNSRKRFEKEETGKFLDDAKEIAMAAKPVDIEVSLDKKPGQSISAGRVKPVSAAGEVQQLQLGENPSVDRTVEKMYYDTDARSETAVNEMYQKGVDNYSIRQSFSVGMLGQENNRELVPTRWSITAVDDIVSKKLRDNLRDFQELGEIRYFQQSYVGNHFHIFLIPGRWEYELIELKKSGSVWNQMENTYIAENYEGPAGRTSYAEETAGAYYAARLGALEYLNEIKRTAKVLIVRDVTPDYWAPLGVWVIRETVRNAFDEYSYVDNMEKLKRELSSEFMFLYRRIANTSKLLSERQTNLKNF